MSSEELDYRAGLQNHDTLGDAECPQIAVPALNRVFLGVAMATEQLHAVEADLHALVGGEPLGQGAFTQEGHALLGTRGTAPDDERRPSSSMAMLAHMNATAWRLAIGSPNAWRSLT